MTGRKCNLAIGILVTLVTLASSHQWGSSPTNGSSGYSNESSGTDYSTGDVYMDEAYNTCYKYKSSLKCVKYKVLKYVFDLTSPYNGLDNDIRLGSSVRLITINRAPSGESPPLFPDSNPRAADSELDKAYKFALRQMVRFVRARALAVSLPVATPGARGLDEDGPRLVDDAQPHKDLQEDEGRGKKKKIAMLLPLALFFKIKAMLVPILLVVLFIKKLLVLGAIAIPGLLSLVKYCKPHPHMHHHSGYHVSHGGDWASAPDNSGEYSTAYTYGKDYQSRRAQMLPYRGYEPRANGVL